MILKSILAGAAAAAVLGNISAAVFVTSAGSTAGSTAADNAGKVGVIWYANSVYNIDSLGVFAPAGSQTDTLTVTLWQEGNPTALRSVDIDTSATAPDSNGFIYASIPSFTTTVGGSGHYGLTVSGYSANKIADNLAPISNSPVAYNSSLYSALSGIVNWSGTGNVYSSGGFNDPTRFTFASFTTTPVPEPEVYASIAGLALVGFGLYRRQIRK